MVQGVATSMNGLEWKEVILGILFPLVLGGYAYSWLSAKALWAGIKEQRDETTEKFRELKENDIKHLEERVERLEQDR